MAVGTAAANKYAIIGWKARLHSPAVLVVAVDDYVTLVQPVPEGGDGTAAPLLSGENEDTEDGGKGGYPIPVSLVADAHEATAFELQHVDPVEAVKGGKRVTNSI